MADDNSTNPSVTSKIGTNGEFTVMQMSDDILNPKYQKYDDVKKLDASQNNPKSIKTINFQQDYIVIIRKKLYYAASVVSQENYLRVYQINNFTSIRTSSSIYGSRPGSCSVTLKGAERVIYAEKTDAQNVDSNFSNWKDVLKEWTSLDDNMGFSNIGSNNWSLEGAAGVHFKSLLKAREAKYGWKFSEKCDWEPMDEIYIFGKSRDEHQRLSNGEYQFKPIFFGFIDSIQKTYQSDKGGLLMTISASDQLKLLDLSKVLNSPSLMPGVNNGGGLDIRYPTDAFGQFIINDPWVNIAGTNATASARYIAYNNVFSGEYPYEIITRLATDAGIPQEFLTKRIEKIKEIPFVFQFKQYQNGDLFTADLKNRLQICSEAANKLFLEFFADEEGNIVLKIPNYALGANKLPENNMGYEFADSFLGDVGYIVEQTETSTQVASTTTTPTTTTTTQTIDNPIQYTVVSGDCLWNIAKRFLGDPTRWHEIYDANRGTIGDNPNLIYPGQTFTIHQETTVTVPVSTTTSSTNGTTTSTVTKTVEDVIQYTVVSGDCLWNIAKRFLGDPMRWHEIYDANRGTIGDNPNLIYPGQTFTIDTGKTKTITETVQQTVQTVKQKQTKIVKGKTLGQKTDHLIPEIRPEYLVSFTLTDTDKEIYNYYEVQMESNIINANDSSAATVIRRAVPDLDSIVRFGLRPHPGVTNTPLISNRHDAELFGLMMIATSLANRYTCSITMIEDSSIRVGNPIRVRLYDETPMKETGLFPGWDAQSVFYITGIERTISPSNVSYMTLALKAGRMMGQESIYDICIPLYKVYYDEKYDVDFTQSLDDYINYYEMQNNYFNYTLEPQDTVQKLIRRFYGDVSSTSFQEIIYAIVALNPDKFDKSINSLNYDLMDRQLYAGENLKLPKALRK